MTGIDRDILITRVLDGEATPEDWAAFRAMAARDQSVWADLADAQQDRAELACALAEAIAIADTVEAPIDRHAGERLHARVKTGAAWLGWAAAAAMALGVFSGKVGPRGAQPMGQTQQAGLFPINTPEDAMQLYLDKGRETGSVLGEVPERVLLDSQLLSDGSGYQVIYLRQVIECQQVPDLFQMGRNEAGEQVPVSMREMQTSWRKKY